MDKGLPICLDPKSNTEKKEQKEGQGPDPPEHVMFFIQKYQGYGPEEEIDHQEDKKESPDLVTERKLAENKPDPIQTTMEESDVTTSSVSEEPDYTEQRVEYRKNLLQNFNEEWQKVPELNTTIRDLAQLPEIDRHFGIIILAYSFVDQKPAPPFLWFNLQKNIFEKSERNRNE